MSNFTIPIQERDNTPLQSPAPVMDNNPISSGPAPENIGEGLAQFGTQAEKQAQALRLRAKQLATYKFRNDATQLSNEQLKPVLAAQGENSFVAGDQASKDLRAGMDKLVSSSPDWLQGQFSLLADHQMNKFDNTSMGHQYQQQKILQDNIEKTRANQLTDEAVNSAYDFNAYKQALEGIKEVATTSTQRKLGGDLGDPSPEVQGAIDVHVKEAQSLAITKTIGSLVSANPDDVQTARMFAKHFEDNITNADKVKINSLLDKGDKRAVVSTANHLMLAAINQFPDMSDPRAAMLREKFISDNAPSGEVAEKAATMHRAETAFFDSQQTKADNENFGQAVDALRKAGGTGAQQIADQFNIDPKHFDEFFKKAAYITSGKETPRDQKTYDALWDQYMNNPSKFKQSMQSPEYLTTKLPDSDIRHFQSLYKEVQDPLIAKQSVKDFAPIVDDIAKTTLTGKLSSPGNRARLADMKDLLIKTTQEVQASMGDRASKEEVYNKVDQLMRTRMAQTVPLGTFGKITNAIGFTDYPDNTVNPVHIGDTLKDRNVNVPHPLLNKNPALTDKVRDALQRNGKDSSDRSVLKVLSTL
jgi:hypothetical protein